MANKKTEPGTSVKSYQQDINLEKQKMGNYTKKMRTSVKSLQAATKSYSKEMKDAGRNMIAEGNRNMNVKVGKFREEIKNQVKENKEAIAHIGNSIQFFLGEVNKKKKDFRAYTRGPFAGYIKAFWGI